MNEKETGMNSPRPAAPLKKNPPWKRTSAPTSWHIFNFRFLHKHSKAHRYKWARGARQWARAVERGLGGPGAATSGWFLVRKVATAEFAAGERERDTFAWVYS